MSKRKKIVIIASFCLLLLLTGTLNVLLNNYVSANADKDLSDTVNAGNFYSNYRERLDTLRQDELLGLNAIINDATTSADAKAVAEKSRQEILSNSTLEQTIATLIVGKGFENVLVIASGNMITVMVKAEVLTDEEVAQIVDVVQVQTGFDIENIEIHPII